MALPKLNSTPKYEMNIPSTGETVRFRPFLIKEEKSMLIAAESGDNRTILLSLLDTLKACCDAEINENKLSTFDVEYMFLKLRAKSVGEIAKLKVLCPDDKKSYGNVDVDLTKVEVYVDDTHNNNIVLDESRKLGVVLKYPSLKVIDSGILSDNIKVSAMYDLIKKSVDHIYEGDKMYYAKDSTPKELDEFIDSLTGEQMRKIQGFFSSMPRLEHKIKVTNPNTKVESEVTLKGLTDFFG